MKTRFLLISLFFSILSSCKVGRYVIYNFADINDHKKFPTRTIKNGSTSFHFSQALTSDNTLKNRTITNGDIVYSFEEYLEESKTVAFLVIQNDTIKYENYLHGYNDTSIVPSFSMAKSVTSILIGCAIDDGFIGSVNEPITQYIPELKKNNFDGVTIEHLLQMTSKLDFNESYYNPFGHAASFYYGTNLRKEIKKLHLKTGPTSSFQYVSGNTQLLGLVLERALKGQTISSYLEEKIWKPLQMEFDASWSLDRKKNGLEKTFCCLNARARDFAKIGRLYLNKGNWNGKQIVSKHWVKQSTKVDTSNGSAWYYQYQWWLPTTNGDFIAEGILGQFIYVNPNKNLIIVRLGKKYGLGNWDSIMVKLAELY